MMKYRFFFPSFVMVCAGAALVGCRTTPAAPPPETVWSVVSVAEVARPETPETLSGLTHLSGSTFLAIEDLGGRLWTMTVAFSPSNTVAGCAFSSCVELEGISDGEGCAFDPLRKTVWVSDESGPSVSEHDLKTGRRLRELRLSDDFSRCRPNRGPEGLTISPDGRTLWTCPEEAVAGDGDLASPTNGTLVRLHRYARSSANASWHAVQEIPYRVDSLGGKPVRGGLSCSGVSGLCALSDGTLLVLERELSQKGLVPSFRLRLYEVRPGRPKRLILSRDTGFAMYEGLSLVLEKPEGEVVLLLVSDGAGIPVEALLSVVLRRANEVPAS